MKFTIEEIKLKILEAFPQNGSEEKFNFLGGRGGSPGMLEGNLELIFTSEERGLAQHAFDQLCHTGYFCNDARQTRNTSSWFQLTEKGKRAKTGRVLDELDEALDLIDPSLKSLRHAAIFRLKESDHDSFRQAAQSTRELIAQTLRKGASDEKVRAQSWFREPITRKQRARYLMEQNRKYSKSDLELFENIGKCTDSLYAKLSSESHRDVSEEHTDLEDLITQSEIMLRRIFL